MNALQTHVTVSDQPAAELPSLPGIYFLGGDHFVTGWALAKRGVEIIPKASAHSVDIPAIALQRGQQAYKDFQGGRP